jgi:hypothetical protein
MTRRAHHPTGGVGDRRDPGNHFFPYLFRRVAEPTFFSIFVTGTGVSDIENKTR